MKFFVRTINTPLVVTSGGLFGDAFDPAQVVDQAWGKVSLLFSSCTTATLLYSGQHRTGSIELVRFSEGRQDFACID